MRLLSVIFALLFCAWPALADCSAREISNSVLRAPICVPETPQRIVVLDHFYNLGMALELGVPVVGGPLMAAPDAMLRTRAEEASVSDIGDARQPSLERVIALKPDLIVGDAQLHGQFYDRLANIAPTALIDTADWKDNLAALAEITGRTDAAAEAVQVYEERIAAIRARVPKDLTVSAIRIALHGFHVYLDGSAAYAPYAVLRDAGVKRTAYETTDDDTVLKRPDWEEIAALDGQILLYVVAAGNAPGQDDELEGATVSNPFWQMLPAVQSGRAYRVDKAHWFGFNSLDSAHRVLDDIERYILNDQ